jgi:NitT/TauT family transport system substrate-binding protein
MNLTRTIGLVAALAGLATAPGHAQQPTLQDVVMAIPNFTFNVTASIVADELHLWEKHGLRVKTLQIQGVGATNAVISGSADFAQIGGPTLTRAAARGQRLLAIAATSDRNIVEISLRKDLAEAAGFDAKAPLEKRAQVLRGRTIAVGAINANPHAFLRTIAARGGIDPESGIRVTQLEGNAMLGAFQTRTVDGISNSPPWPLAPVLDGSAVMIASGPAGDPNPQPFAYNVVVAKPETCQKRKAVCAAMGAVFREALTFLHQHPNETVDILQKQFATLGRPLIAASFEEILKATPKTPLVTRDALENTESFNVDGGLLKAEDKLKSYDGLFTDEYVR